MNSPTPDTVVVMTAEMADHIRINFNVDAGELPFHAVFAIASGQVACHNTATHEAVSKKKLAELRGLSAANLVSLREQINEQAARLAAAQSSNAALKIECENLREIRRQDINFLRRNLTAAESKAAEYKGCFDVLDEALVVAGIYTKEHDTNPRKAINDLVNWNCAVALDPAVSEDAVKLIAPYKEKAAAWDAMKAAGPVPMEYYGQPLFALVEPTQ